MGYLFCTDLETGMTSLLGEVSDFIIEVSAEINEFMRKIQMLTDESFTIELPVCEVGYCPTPKEIERFFWPAAAALAYLKAQIRAQAFAVRMQHEKARRAMKRRKLLHAEGSFPDVRCCATCRYHGPIGAPILPACCGCIVGGECTKWQPAGGDPHYSGE